MGDRYDDDDTGADSSVDIRVRQTFLRADYDVDQREDRRAFAEDMSWVRGHKKYTTMRSARRNTALLWLLAAILTAVIGQSIPAKPFSVLFHLIEGTDSAKL